MSGPDEHVPYRLYIFDISYFSGKVEAYLRYKRIPYRRMEPNWGQMVGLVLPNTGGMRLPVIQTTQGKWLQDSTPMLDWFEQRYPKNPILPSCPVQAFVARVVEDYADEWMWRPALYYRWAYALDRELYGQRFVDDFLYDFPLPRGLIKEVAVWRQRLTYVYQDGITPRTAAHCERIYKRTLGQLEACFRQRPYLFGDSPSLADFGFFASMFRHFSIDPTPARMMRQGAPAVYEWVARLWNQAPAEGGPNWAAADGELPPGILPILRSCGDEYFPYLIKNAAAYNAGKPRFGAQIAGVQYKRLPTVRYRVGCAQSLVGHFQSLSPAHQAAVRSLFEKAGGWQSFEALFACDAGYPSPAGHPAECSTVQPSFAQKARAYIWGKAWEDQMSQA